MVTAINQLSYKYECVFCNIKTSNKKDFTKHQTTAKHLKNQAGDKNGDIGDKNGDIGDKTISIIQCIKCNKKYSSRNGLWKHSKICKHSEPTSEPPLLEPALEPAQASITEANAKPRPSPIYMTQSSTSMPPDITFFTNLVLEVVKNNAELQKQNQDFQKQMLEMYKTSNNVTNNSHSHNKTFNMQFFLNETCKDAMNIMDFVNTMTLEFSDLEDVGKLGYVEGISNIIIRKLNALDVNKRPIHCSDAKREIMYVKDENIWEKENSTYDKLRKAIKHITCKNSAMLEPWSKAHPQCMNNQHRLNDVYVQMMGQAMGGKESFLESENKIMKKIAKAVLIEKV
jgi:hypothetical protein